MSGLFASRPSGEPWFRLGRLEVTTVMFVVLAVVGSWLAWVIVPTLPSLLYYSPEALADGQVWRLVTWPFAEGLTLWSVLTLFFFWYFSTELENLIGRNRMVWLLLGLWASVTAAATLTVLLLGGAGVLAGFNLVEFVVLLLWIAEFPHRKFFFGIPAWVIGVVLIGVQALGMLASRSGSALVSLLLSVVLVALVAKRVGLLREYAWIPGGRSPERSSRPRAPKVSRPRARAERRTLSDQEQLDALLDQINDKGIHSLSAAQRRELMRLRARLRQG
ncbi:MAG: DUF6576 domain-containing protein [Propionicimonas sp.]